MAAPPGTAQHAPQSTGRRLIWLWVPVVFLVGLLAGGVIVAVFSNGTTVHTPGRTTTVTAAPPSSGAPQITVDAACMRAVRDAQGVYALLGRITDAVRSLDAGTLDEIVHQLGQLRHQLAADLGDCHGIAQLPNGPTPSR